LAKFIGIETASTIAETSSIPGVVVNVLVTHDGSADAESALRYSALKVMENGGGMISLYVFQGLEDGEGDFASKVRSMDAPCSLKNSEPVGLNVLLGKGDPKAEILGYTLTENVDLIVTVPSCSSFVKDTSIPVSMIPATILVPMDDRPMLESVIRQITGEALSTCSKLLLLGIVPIHLYNPSEEAELDAVKDATMKAVEQAASALGRRGIQVEEMLRMGYPDEEIIRAAEENRVSMIVIPCDSDQSSELNKAASIILDEIKQVNIPILYLPV
jgi:nucleotide-binding universal stress UspA family protein